MENYHIWAFQEENSLINQYTKEYIDASWGFLQLYNKNVYD